MVRLIETVTFKSGGTQTKEKKFSTRMGFLKSLRSSPVPNHLQYQLVKNGAATVEYADATVEMKVVDETPERKIVDLNGNPIIK